VVTRRPAAGLTRVEQKVGARETILSNSWRGHLRGVDRALGQCDVDEARRAWKSAHLAAVESFSWEGLIATGQASLRIGDATEGRPLAEPAARRAFFAALYRACRENSSRTFAPQASTSRRSRGRRGVPGPRRAPGGR
jgi:hypothetical protein